MTDKEILEGNKLIAEFIGLKYLGKNLFGFGGDVFDCTKSQNNSKNILIENGACLYLNTASMRYHSSWDWLMPVVEKIEELGYEFSINSQTVGIGEYMTAGEINWSTEIDRQWHTFINSIYLTVVEFIKWYNKNIKK